MNPTAETFKTLAYPNYPNYPKPTEIQKDLEKLNPEKLKQLEKLTSQQFLDLITKSLFNGEKINKNFLETIKRNHKLTTIIQKALKNEGFRLKIDGIFGPRTFSSLLTYKQTKNFENKEQFKNSIENIVNNYIPKFQFKTLNTKDILALIKMETNLDYHNLISATGSKGIMQLTTVALKDLKKNINKFPEDLQPQLKNKLDIKDRYQLYEKLFNIEDNIFLGMAYLKLLEQTYLPNAKHKLVGWIKKLTSHPTYYNLDKVVGKYIKARGLAFDTEKFHKMLDDLKTDPSLQEKFLLFRRYNGDTNTYSKNGEKTTHRNYYALTTLYMSLYNNI